MIARSNKATRPAVIVCEHRRALLNVQLSTDDFSTFPSAFPVREQEACVDGLSPGSALFVG